MVTMFTVVDDSKVYKFTAKQPAHNKPYVHYCNGSMVEAKVYNQWLEHFKAKRTADKAKAPF